MYILKFLIFHLIIFLFLTQCTIKDKYIENIKLKKNWTNFIEKDKNTSYFSLNPIIIDDYLFIPNENGIITIVNKHNGNIKKQINLIKKIKKNNIYSSEFISSGLATDGKNIYFGSELSKVYCINKNGSLIWESNLMGEVSSPVIDNENELVFIHTENDMLYALKKSDGKTYWLMDFGSKEISIKGISKPLILNNEIGIISTNNGYIIVFKIDDGSIIWEKSIYDFLDKNTIDFFLQDIDITPIIQNEIVYVSSYNGYILALDLFSGSIIWKKNIFNNIKNMFIKNNILSIVQNNGIIFSLDANTGDFIWKKNFFLYHNLLAINAYKEYLFIKDASGYIYLININNGIITYQKKVSSSHSKTHFFFEKNNFFTYSINGKISSFKIQIKN